jgi:hypothetical protein
VLVLTRSSAEQRGPVALEAVRRLQEREVPASARRANALNHTQFTGVNATVNFASLTDHTISNLPYNAAGQLVNKNGFGTINGVNIPRTLQLVTRLTF